MSTKFNVILNINTTNGETLAYSATGDERSMNGQIFVFFSPEELGQAKSTKALVSMLKKGFSYSDDPRLAEVESIFKTETPHGNPDSKEYKNTVAANKEKEEFLSMVAGLSSMEEIESIILNSERVTESDDEEYTAEVTYEYYPATEEYLGTYTGLPDNHEIFERDGEAGGRFLFEVSSACAIEDVTDRSTNEENYSGYGFSYDEDGGYDE